MTTPMDMTNVGDRESDDGRELALRLLERACEVAVKAADYPLASAIRKVINEHHMPKCPTCGRREQP